MRGGTFTPGGASGLVTTASLVTGWVDDAADVVGVAAGLWIGLGGALSEVAYCRAGVAEFGDAPVGFGEVLVDELGDVAAGCFAAVAEGEDAADLGGCEAGVLRVTDEGETCLGGGRVVAVTAGGSGWWGQQTGLLVCEIAELSLPAALCCRSG